MITRCQHEFEQRTPQSKPVAEREAAGAAGTSAEDAASQQSPAALLQREVDRLRKELKEYDATQHGAHEKRSRIRDQLDEFVSKLKRRAVGLFTFLYLSDF